MSVVIITGCSTGIGLETAFAFIATSIVEGAARPRPVKAAARRDG